MKVNTFKIIAVIIVLSAGAGLAYAQETSADFSGGSIIIGYDNTACAAGIAGSLRYDSSSNEMEYCDGTNWGKW